MSYGHHFARLAGVGFIAGMVACNEGPTATQASNQPIGRPALASISPSAISGPREFPIAGLSYTYSLTNTCAVANYHCVYHTGYGIFDYSAPSQGLFQSIQWNVPANAQLLNGPGGGVIFGVQIDTACGGSVCYGTMVQDTVTWANILYTNPITGLDHVSVSGTYAYSETISGNTSHWSDYGLQWGGWGSGTGTSTSVSVDVCSGDLTFPLSVSLTAGGRSQTVTKNVVIVRPDNCP